jgi:hypothetical protein
MFEDRKQGGQKLAASSNISWGEPIGFFPYKIREFAYFRPIQ